MRINKSIYGLILKYIMKIGVKKHTVVNNYVDSHTGELIDVDIQVKKESVVFNSKESFFMGYSAIIGVLNKLNGASVKVLQWSCIKADYNTNRISLQRVVCEEIAESLGLSYSAVKNAIVSLVKSGVFVREGVALYRINPKYYWRGDSASRSEAMKFILEFEFNNK